MTQSSEPNKNKLPPPTLRKVSSRRPMTEGVNTTPSGPLLNAESPAKELRKLLRNGVEKKEALSLVAQMYGMPITDGIVPVSWTLKEIQAVLFLQYRLALMKERTGSID